MRAHRNPDSIDMEYWSVTTTLVKNVAFYVTGPVQHQSRQFPSARVRTSTQWDTELEKIATVYCTKSSRPRPAPRYLSMPFLTR